MKFQLLIVLGIACTSKSFAFINHSFGVTSSSTKKSTSLSMVLEMPKDKKTAKEKKLSKLEILKTKSDHLTNPLKEVSIFV